MAVLFLTSTSPSEEKAFLDLVTATAERSVPSQPGDALPRQLDSLAARALSQRRAGCRLSGRSGWSDGVETFSRHHRGEQDKSR